MSTNLSPSFGPEEPLVLEGEKSVAMHMVRGRLFLLGALFGMGLLLMGARALDVTFLRAMRQGDAALLDSGSTASSLASVRRGAIVDRNGELLATTLKVPSLFVDPQLISAPPQAAAALARIFPDLTYADILRDLQGPGRFHWIKRHITPAQQKAVLLIGEPGLGFRDDFQRIYPQGNLAAHLLGFANVDTKGLSGAERMFDPMLAAGQEVLHLSLDIRLQHVLRREIKAAMDEFRAQGGFGIVMDVNTGEVLAGVSLPDFDPNHLAKIEKEQIFNRLSQGVYELGSVFKIFSTAAFLESKEAPLDATFDASQPLRRGRFAIRDFHAQDRMLSLPEVFMYSSNIGAAMMGEAVGTKKLKAFYDDLGLLRPLAFESAEIGKPLVPDPWRDLNTLTAAYGHGLATTPLQMSAAVASIVNGGTLIRPTLLLKDRAQTQQNIRVVSSETAAMMRALLRLAVTDGTGSKADVPGYDVGGKTGTAEKIIGGRYDPSRLLSSFVGVFPADHPRYVVFIALDEPKGYDGSRGYSTGGWTAAPAAAQVIAAMVSILGISPRAATSGEDISAPFRHYISSAVIHE